LFSIFLNFSLSAVFARFLHIFFFAFASPFQTQTKLFGEERIKKMRREEEDEERGAFQALLAEEEEEEAEREREEEEEEVCDA